MSLEKESGDCTQCFDRIDSFTFKRLSLSSLPVAVYPTPLLADVLVEGVLKVLEGKDQFVPIQDLAVIHRSLINLRCLLFLNKLFDAGDPVYSHHHPQGSNL